MSCQHKPPPNLKRIALLVSIVAELFSLRDTRGFEIHLTIKIKKKLFLFSMADPIIYGKVKNSLSTCRIPVSSSPACESTNAIVPYLTTIVR